MFVKSFLVLLALLVLTSAAEAGRYRQATSSLSPECNVTMPCVSFFATSDQARRKVRGRYVARQLGFGGPVVRTHRPHVAAPAIDTFSSSAISRPLHYIAGRLVCAVNVNAALAARGIRGTGSALAHSFDHWGHASGPVPGAVAVTDRRGGGHVAIVSRVEGGRTFVWNATGGRHGWYEMEYTNRHARYRVAG